MPLFAVRTNEDGQRVVTGIEPVFNDRLNPGNNLLVRITVSRYWRYYVVSVSLPRRFAVRPLVARGWLCGNSCSAMLCTNQLCNRAPTVMYTWHTQRLSAKQRATQMLSFAQVNTLVPIILTGILGFTVFLIPSNDIEKRLSASFQLRF